MLNFALILRWFIYLIFCSSSCEGSYPYPQQMDARLSSTFVNSSPKLYNNTEQLYSTWSQWTSCSSTCGVGISTRNRTCLKSTYNSRGVSIPLCHGDFSEHKICTTQNCPANTPDVREFQCSQYNNRTVAGKFVKVWTPTNEGPNPCELRCEAKSEKLVYGFGKVSNGTPCPLGVCLDGRCLKVGCDDRLGSEVSLDMCGVCGGRNASCVHYKDVYQGQPSADSDRRDSYREVVVIPVGARNLIIRHAVGKNFIAMQDRKKGIIFNREHPMTKYGGHYEIAGTVMEFIKLDNETETIRAKGPIAEELYVLVLLRSPNRGIFYEYWLPQIPYSSGRNHFSLRTYNNVDHLAALHPVKTETTQAPTLHTTVETTESRSHHHHPTKPPFAYAYGEKPYKGRDLPIFRHIPSTTASPHHDLRNKPSYPVQSKADSIPGQYNGGSQFSYSNNKKDPYSLYKPRYLERKLEPAGYYQTFRNASRVESPKSPIFDRESPVLTQQDSSSPNGRGSFENAIPNSVLQDTKQELSAPKSSKPPRSAIEIRKRGEKTVKNYVPNGRLKYSFEGKNTDEVYINSSGRYTPAPLSIAVLPLPDGDASKSRKRKRKDGPCEPCQRSRDQTKHFCESDFVIRAFIISYEFLQGETRYELEVKQAFKNTLSLLPKEYVWSPDTCRCPRLKPGKEYVIMGKIDNTYRKRESRLLVDKTCFVRTFNLKYARRLQKLRKQQSKKCKKTS